MTAIAVAFQSPPTPPKDMVKIKVLHYTLLDKEIFRSQKRFLSLKYGESQYTTKDCLDGLDISYFGDLFTIPLLEGLWEIDIFMWNKNTRTGSTSSIGRGRILLKEVLHSCHDYSFWALYNESGRYAGAVELEMETSFPRMISISDPPTPPPQNISSLNMRHFIGGHNLCIRVVGYGPIRDSKYMSPYVCLKYANFTFTTENCKADGDCNCKFGDMFNIQLVDGIFEISISIWSKNSIRDDDFIGGGRILLHEVLERGYDNSFWAMETKSGRYAGAIQLTMQSSFNRCIFLNEPSEVLMSSGKASNKQSEIGYGLDVMPSEVPYYTATKACLSIPPPPPYAPKSRALPPKPQLVYEHGISDADEWNFEEDHELIEEHELIVDGGHCFISRKGGI